MHLEKDQGVRSLKLWLGAYITESSAEAVSVWVLLQLNEEEQTEGAGRTVSWEVQLTQENPLLVTGGEP